MKKCYHYILFLFSLATISSSSFSQVQLIYDGGFEIGASWFAPLNFQYGPAPNPNNGTNYAYLADFQGYPANNISGTISQEFTVPPNTNDIDIEFHFRISTQEITNVNIYDYCQVVLENVNNVAIQIPIAYYSNLDAAPFYQQEYTNIANNLSGQTWRIKFFAQNDGALPSVFRIDDVSIIANPVIQNNCISWAGAINPGMNIDTSMELLCANGIISSFQDANTLNNNISKMEIAQCIGKALFGDASNLQFLDNFPNIYEELNTLNIDDIRYAKMMLYLEYPSVSNPIQGTDYISPFNRKYLYPTLSYGIRKSDAIKALMEAYNKSPYMVNYDPASVNLSPIACDLVRNHINLGWVEAAKFLGILENNFISPCGANGLYFGPDNNISYSEFYLMLAKIITSPPQNINYNSFFKPFQANYSSTDDGATIEKGIFNFFNKEDLHVEAGSFDLDFVHSYHSNLTEYPLLQFDNDLENRYLKTKIQPLGGGWTHSYNIFIMADYLFSNTPERYHIVWPDGTIHVYSLLENKYLTKGVNDVLSLDSFVNNIPTKVTIRKGRTKFIFRQIDPSSYRPLVISEIVNANNDELIFDYVDGTGPNPNLLTIVLNRVTETHSGRHLDFYYHQSTNYLAEVKDDLNRSVKFYPNMHKHELDSSVDAKGVVTKYIMAEVDGTIAYRSHLLEQIQLPKGNIINNQYKQKKLSQYNQQNLIIDITSIPNYQNAWNTQQSNITVTQNNQSLNYNYTFDEHGNNITLTTPTESIIKTYDTVRGLLTKERNITNGIQTSYSYDALGFETKKVIFDSIYNDSIKYEVINNIYGEPYEFMDYNDPTNANLPTITHIVRDVQGGITDIILHPGTPEEVKKSFLLDIHGDVFHYFSPTNHEIGYTNSNGGDKLAAQKYPFGGIGPILQENYSYDNIGRIRGITNPDGVVNRIEYDNNDNTTSVTIDSANLVLKTQYFHDQNDNLATIVSPKGNQTVLYYDFDTDNLIKEFDGQFSKKFTYNKDNSIDSFITKNNHVFKYRYFDTVAFPNTPFKGLLRDDGITLFDYYPQTKSQKSITNMATLKSLEYEYTNPNAILFKRGKFNTPEIVKTSGFINGDDRIKYEYNKALKPESIITTGLANNVGYRYVYDFTTKKQKYIDDYFSNKRYVIYDYFKDGRIKLKTLGNGDTVHYHYDSYARLDSMWAINKQNALLYSIGVTLDSTGKITRENTNISFGGIIDTTVPNVINGQQSNYLYNPQNRIISADVNTITSDNNGNITQIGGVISSNWNDYSQLISYTDNGNTTTYDYDPLGHRRQKDNVRYIVDAENYGNILLETDDILTPKSMYVWGDDGLVCRVNPITNESFYYHFDMRGSVNCITDSNGAKIKLYKYDEFGIIYKDTGTISWNNPYKYIGKHGVEFDNNDLYYMKARYYKPGIGRFIGEDPVWSTNLFPYADNDPVNKIDPDGNKANFYLDAWRNSLRNTRQRVYNAFNNPETYKTALDATMTLASLEISAGKNIRLKAVNLAENLALQEVKSNPYIGNVIMEKLNDWKWKGWYKMKYIKKLSNGKNIVIHYYAKWKNNIIVAVDEFKFK